MQKIRIVFEVDAQVNSVDEITKEIKDDWKEIKDDFFNGSHMMLQDADKPERVCIRLFADGIKKLDLNSDK